MGHFSKQNDPQVFPIFGLAGVGFSILFTALKLTGVITIKWVWALAPLWIPAALILLILIGVIVTMLVFYKLEKNK